ncbi:MAG: PGPGW domain-containing protein [Angustibacter sp.]
MDTQSDPPDSRYSDPGFLIDSEEDRFAWRARIKRNPITRRIYRAAVGFVGVLLIILAALTGWLPGPGGIPLALLGLAILASEFEWADRLLMRVKRWGKSAARWMRAKPRWYRRALIAVIIVVALGLVYSSLALSGVPTWLPNSVESVMLDMPGLSD